MKREELSSKQIVWVLPSWNVNIFTATVIGFTKTKAITQDGDHEPECYEFAQLYPTKADATDAAIIRTRESIKNYEQYISGCRVDLEKLQEQEDTMELPAVPA